MDFSDYVEKSREVTILLKESAPVIEAAVEIDQMIEIGVTAGAWGAKLLGAGAGGYVMFLGDEGFDTRLREIFDPKHLLSVGFQPNGTQLIEFGQHE